MHRSLGPILLISLGLILVILFFIVGRTPEDRANAGTPLPPNMASPGAQDPVSGDSPPFLESGGQVISATQTPQPIVPTPTVGAPGAESKLPPSPSPVTTPDPRRCPLPDCLDRIGVSGRLEDIAAASRSGLPFGNYFDWWLASQPPFMVGNSSADQPRYWQLVSVRQGGVVASWSEIEEVVAARPGSIWIVGNEPDVAWQDNTTAEAYATIYHDVYEFIKDRDPSAKVAIAGVSQPSPLRFAYLEQVLSTYQAKYGKPMPVDIWTVHAFILREQAGSWGVGIPPGMEDTEGLLYEIADHDDLTIFRQSLISFRQWMSDHGYGGAPLAVTEFGILHPADYGFPAEAVIEFMIGAMDFMASATGDTGNPEDGDRLVQYWFWFSVYNDGDFPTGNLYDVPQERMTAVGRAYRRYLTGQ